MVRIKSHINRQVVHYTAILIGGLLLALWFAFILPFIATELIPEQYVPAFAKVPSVQAAASFVRSDGVAGTSFSLNIGTAGTDRLIVVLAGDESDTINLTGATVDGKACNLVTRATNPDGAGNHQEMWYCDEDDLGASAGTVTVAIQGGDSGWATHAHLYTGVSQTGPTDFGINNTTVGGTTISVTGIDVPADGLVVMSAAHGDGSPTVSSWTSPLETRQSGPNPSSAHLANSSGIESSAQTNKTYTATFSTSFVRRATGIVAVWPAASAGPPSLGSGTILREWWTGISGNAVSDLTSNVNYPDSPTGSDEPTLFEAPTNWADNYGTRMRGYVHPPTTGSYTFWIASDDNSELWLSSDDTPAGASLIASVPTWTSSREWTKYGSQQSASIPLVGGQKYYIEALQKEGGGGDNLAVAWQGPGISQQVIPGAYLSPWTGGPPPPPTITVNRRQSDPDTNLTEASATFAQPPVEGNLLVAYSMHRENGDIPLITGTGWNLAINDCYMTGGGGGTCGPSSSSSRRAMAVWWKIAGSGEPTNIRTSWSPPSNNGLIIQEFEIVGGGTFTYDTRNSRDSLGSAVSSLTSGSTAQSAQIDSLLVTTMGSRGLTGAASWTRGIGDNIYFDASVGIRTIGMNTGFGVDAVKNTKESTGSWSTAQQATVGILVFSLSSTPPPPPPPTVDLKGKSTAAVSGDGPISITSGNNVTLEWSSIDAAACVASSSPANPDWDNPSKPTSGTDTIPGVAVDTTFTLNCTNIVGFDVDSFTANILTASLSANPTGGMAPLNGVDLRATAGGTSSGTYRYFFDCNNGSPVINTGDIVLNPYTESAACNYGSAGNYNPTVTIWHSEGTAQATTPITVSSDLSPTITNVLNDGPVEEVQVITFDVTWADTEGIGSGYLVICKDPDPGAPLSDTWPPQCQSGYWNDMPPVAVSGTGATTQIQYTTQTGDAASNTNGWAYVCQAQNECNPSSGASNTVFTINAPASNDDLLAINLSAPSSIYDINDTFAYVLTVTNNGLGDTTTATNVFVQVTLPSEVSIENPIPSSCTPLPLAGDTGISVSCDMGTLGIPGAFKTEFFNVTAMTERVNSIATAELTSSLPEDNSPPPGDSSNNTDMAIVTIVDPSAIPNAIPTLNSQYPEPGGPFASGPQLFWDDSITSAVDLDVTVDGETTITFADPANASGTLTSRPIDSRAFNGVAPYKFSFWGDLPDTERDPAFFLRNAMYNPTTGLIGTNCEDLPGNAPYDDNCTTDPSGSPTGEPSGEWRVGVDSVTGRYGGQIISLVTDTHLNGTGQGWAWSDSVGWIAFSCDTPKFDSFGNPIGFAGNCAAENDWHVEEDTAVPLAVNRPVTGWAWSPVIGWVAFGCDSPGLVGVCGSNWDRGDGNDGTPGNDSVWVDENGIYHGWAWSGMVGWISMNCNESPAPYDTCASGGSLARSASGGYSQAQVSIAASRCPNAETDPPNCETPGTWIYSAPYTFNDIGNLGGGNFEINLANDLAALWNTRYVRYQMTLCSFPDCGLLGTPNAPTIKGVSVLWAP